MVGSAFVSPTWTSAANSRRLPRCCGRPRTRRPPRRGGVTPTAKWAFDHVPDWVKELDREEVERRKNDEPMPDLPPQVLEKLHEMIPQLKEIDRFFEDIEAEAKLLQFDPDKSDAPYSWMYLKLRPWVPNTPFLLLAGSVASWALFSGLRFVHNHSRPATLAAAFVAFDTAALFLLGVVAPVAFVLATRTTEEQQTNANDAVARSATMFGTTALALVLPAWLFSSIGCTQTALAVDVVTRAVALPVALWAWNDIRLDTAPGEERIMRLFRAWRSAATAVVCVLGVFARCVALMRPHVLPLATWAQSVAEPLRVMLGERFPVAFSLARDPGGVYFLAFLVVFAACINALHVAIASTDFLAIRDHRRTARSCLTAFCEARGIYGSAEGWALRMRGPSSAPPGVKAYRPSPAMLLLPRDTALFRSDSSLIQNERTMPIIQFLDEEEVVANEKGVKHWLKPRDEWLQPTDSLDKDPLRYWANALTPEQEKGSISDYFDLLGENDYEYDPDVDEWVYSGKTNGLADVKLTPDEDENSPSVFV